MDTVSGVFQMRNTLIHHASVDLFSHFRVFALRCAVCQMPITPQPVSRSAVLTCEWKGREWRGIRAKGGVGLMSGKEGSGM